MEGKLVIFICLYSGTHATAKTQALQISGWQNGWSEISFSTFANCSPHGQHCEGIPCTQQHIVAVLLKVKAIATGLYFVVMILEKKKKKQSIYSCPFHFTSAGINGVPVTAGRWDSRLK